MPRDLHRDLTREGFLSVYRVDNGLKVEVPAHYMEDTLLSRPFRLTPRQRAAQDADRDVAQDAEQGD